MIREFFCRRFNRNNFKLADYNHSLFVYSSDSRDNNSNIIVIYIDVNIFNCIVGRMGVAKQQIDLKRSFSQIYQIDRNIFIDRSERSERVEKERSHYVIRSTHWAS